jgi:hypothetical protein
MTGTKAAPTVTNLPSNNEITGFDDVSLIRYFQKGDGIKLYIKRKRPPPATPPLPSGGGVGRRCRQEPLVTESVNIQLCGTRRRT